MQWQRVAVAGALALVVLAPAQQVFAHAGLEASVPSANAVLEEGPSEIELDFNEAVDAELADIELYDQEANLVATGLPESITDDTIVQASVPEIGDGVYVVVWRVPSADGHVVNGVFSFQVGVQSGVDVGALIDKVSGGATATSTVGRLDTAARLLALIGLIVVIGGGLLAVQSADSSPNRMLLWLGWVFLLVGSLGSFGLYGAKVVAGAPADAIKPSVWGKVVGSHTASVLLVRIVLVIAFGGMLLTFARRRERRVARCRPDDRRRAGADVFEHRPCQRATPGAVVDRHRCRASRRDLIVDRRAADVRVRHRARG